MSFSDKASSSLTIVLPGGKVLILRGSIVYRSYGTLKNLYDYIHIFLREQYMVLFIMALRKSGQDHGIMCM